MAGDAENLLNDDDAAARLPGRIRQIPGQAMAVGRGEFNCLSHDLHGSSSMRAARRY
jgi:hypothetical protein